MSQQGTRQAWVLVPRTGALGRAGNTDGCVYKLGPVSGGSDNEAEEFEFDLENYSYPLVILDQGRGGMKVRL